jgi:hypothetical protein
VKESFADTLDQVASSSTLRELVVAVDNFSDACVASIAKEMRTNTAMESIVLVEAAQDPSGQQSRPFLPIAQTLETNNFTLQNVTVCGLGQTMDRICRGGIPTTTFLSASWTGTAGSAARSSSCRGYHVAPTNSLWPRVLGVFSPLPTLLYRFLRKGEVNLLGSLLQRDGSARGHKKRGRA